MCNIIGCTEVNPILFTKDEYVQHLNYLEKLISCTYGVWELMELVQRKQATKIIIANWR